MGWVAAGGVQEASTVNMNWTTLRRLAAAMLLVSGGFVAVALGRAAAAQPGCIERSLVLRGSGPFGKAVAWATVTCLAANRYHLTLTAEHLPPPMILRVRFPRHAYVAWLVDGTVMRGPLRIAAIGLAAGPASQTYSGEGTVTIGAVTSVIISAEPAAQAHMPIMPILTVMAGSSGERSLETEVRAVRVTQWPSPPCLSYNPFQR
jgi:hypothetical protein